jgi:AcrR family transcriptional regulator
MRMVAEEAGVSTGMLNHYFANRLDLLTQALAFVSMRAHARIEGAIAGVPAGPQRVAALLENVLDEDAETVEAWRVSIYAYGEAVRLPQLRQALEERLKSWYELIDQALEGTITARAHGELSPSRELDAIINGLTIRALTTGASLDREQIRDEVMRAVGMTVSATG